MICERCGRDHPSENCDRSLVFMSYVFSPPYLCMCCGSQVDARQWVEHHTCKNCQTGSCGSGLEWHPRPSWAETDDGTEAFELYAQYSEAIPRYRFG